MLRVVDRRRNSFRRFVLLAYFSQLYPHSPFCFPSTTFTTLLAVYRMKMVRRRSFPAVALPLLAVWALVMVVPCFAGDPYAYFDWDVSFITAAPLGVKQQVLSSVSSRLLLQCTCIPLLFCEVIGIDGQFPGPVVNVTTNWNVVVNVLNDLDEPLLITWYSFVFYLRHYRVVRRGM
ncbi:hypothetical protein BHM03_00040193 [Ensete ventricosum]|nr:hypothetical protein BHM03_00040193 [Ensete ventricosum]